MLKPEQFKAGDLIDWEGNDYYLIIFIKEVRKNGVWVEMAYRPQPYIGTLEKYKNTIFYHLLANHGGFMQFKNIDWEGRKFFKIAHIPALINGKSIRIGI